MEEIINAKNLGFAYGGNEVVSDVSFSVEKGDYIALLGHNGSGKTTLVKLLLGLLPPSRGSVTIFGTDIGKFRQWQRIGYLPQNIGLFNPMFPATVREVVSLGSWKNPDKVTATLEQMNLIALSDKLIGELSGGQIQRTLLARAIVNQPELLVLDEPVSSIDPETRKEFFEYTARLNKEKKTTILLITHDVGHSVDYTNKLMFMDKKILFYGGYGQFCASPIMEAQFGAEIQHIVCHQDHSKKGHKH